jgi:hypothetical protein
MEIEENRIDINLLLEIDNKDLQTELLDTLSEINSIIKLMKDNVKEHSCDEISQNIRKFQTLVTEFIKKLKKY